MKYSLCLCVLLHLSLSLWFMFCFFFFGIEEDKEKGLVVIATAVNVVNALAIDLFMAMDKFSKRIQMVYAVRWLNARGEG